MATSVGVLLNPASYAVIHTCVFGLSGVGINFVANTGSTAMLTIRDNTIENTTIIGIQIATTTDASFPNGRLFGFMFIHHNEFSMVDQAANGFQGSIVIQANAADTDWLNDVTIEDNLIYNQADTTATCVQIWVNSGKRIYIRRNRLDNFSNALINALGIFISAAPLDVIVDSNRISATFSGALYTVTAETLFLDQQGMAVASLPAAVREGSMVWCTNGNPDLANGDTMAATGSADGAYAVMSGAGVWVK